MDRGDINPIGQRAEQIFTRGQRPDEIALQEARCGAQMQWRISSDGRDLSAWLPTAAEHFLQLEADAQINAADLFHRVL